MNKILIADNPFITMWAYPDRKLIHHHMKAYCHGADFRDALLKGLTALRTYKATKWLSDDRANGALPRVDEEWATTSWFPLVLAAGWRHWAIVQPAKVIGRINMARVTRKYNDLGMNVRMFSDPDEAMTWLDALA